VRWLYQEIDAWTADGVIGAETAELIRSRYPTPKPVDWRGRLVTALSVMAAVLLGLGVILFFAANWEVIPRFGKLALIIAIMTGTYIAGYVLRYEKEYERVGGALIFLGTILYGAAIALVAQAFHIREHFPNGFLLWAAGILPMALVVRSPYILSLFTIVLCAWSGTETFHFDNFGPFPLIVILGVVFPLAYRFENRFSVFIGIIAAGFFLFEGTAFEIARHRDPGPGLIYVTMALSFGCLLWVAGNIHQRLPSFRRYANVYQAPGLVLALSMLYLASFPEVMKEVYFQDRILLTESLLAIAFTAVIAALALAAFGILAYRGKYDRAGLIEIGACVGLIAVMVALTYLIMPMFGREEFKEWVAGAFAVCVNVTLIALLVGMIVQGHRHGRPLLINAGMLMFALVLATRYVDIFWGMMSTSLFFIVGGAVLLAGGIFLEKQRRRLLGSAGEVKS
jgi:uncharacterized membrane protein